MLLLDARGEEEEEEEEEDFLDLVLALNAWQNTPLPFLSGVTITGSRVPL